MASLGSVFGSDLTLGGLLPYSFTGKNGVKITIRQADVQDAGELLAIKLGILQEGIYDSLQPDEYVFEIEQESAWIAECLSGMANLLIVAEAEGRVVGVLYFRASLELRCAHWGEFGMGIEPAWRNQGVGKALLKVLMDWAEAHPTVEKVCLRVFDINPVAVKLYKKLGFVEEGRLKKCLKVGPGNYSDAILMARFVK